MEEATQKDVLKLISNGEDLMIEALDGQRRIAYAKNVFRRFISLDFEKRGLDQPGPATAATLVEVQKIIRDATFTEIFTNISSDLDSVVMTQHQIIRFCEKHPFWLRKGGKPTLFLTKMGQEYFVVFVIVMARGLNVNVLPYQDTAVWGGQSQSHVVHPKMVDDK